MIKKSESNSSEHILNDFAADDVVAEYKYDIYGRRLQKNVNGVITNFFWEGDNLSFELNQNNQPIRRYIYENGMDDAQGHVEYAEVDDPEYFSPEHKGWYSYIKDQVDLTPFLVHFLCSPACESLALGEVI